VTLLMLAFWLTLLTATAGAIGSPRVIRTIGFGSCIDASRAHPLLGEAARREQDLFIFLGDNVYADARTPSRFEEAYAELAESEQFRRLQSVSRTLAIWDDHDYGLNDSGAGYRLKQASEEAFLDFWEVPEGDPRRERPGIYTAGRFGPPGRRVQILLLDTRRFRSPLLRGNQAPEGEHQGPYRRNRDPQATLLGEAQWRWLQGELEKPADLRIIASSIQVLVEHHGWEGWANFPEEQERLFALLRRTGAAEDPLLFISGDRHFGEITRRRVPHDEEPMVLREITSSGINRRYPPDLPLTENRYRVGSGVREYNFGEIRVDWSGPGEPRVVGRLLTGADEIAAEVIVAPR
jgi:alkaline phosphatase D